MTEIPELQDTGSAGTQETEPAQAVSPALPEGALERLPLAKAVEGLAATRSRSMGGEVAASLLAGSFNQISHELNEAKNELRETRNELKPSEST